MIVYLSVGFGFYLGVAILRRHTFNNQNVVSVLRGFILGVLLWPVAATLIPFISEDFITLPVEPTPSAEDEK